LANQLPWGEALTNAIAHPPGCACPLCAGATRSANVLGLPVLSPADPALDRAAVVSPVPAVALSGLLATQTFEVSTLQESAGSAVLLGGAGNDLLIGSRGRDLLLGGIAGDQFAPDSISDLLNASGTPLAPND